MPRIASLSLLAAALLLSSPLASAYPRKGRTNNHEHCGDRFDAKKLEKQKGKVREVAKETEVKGSEAVHLQVQLDSERVAVRLGPARILDEAGVRIKEGDEVTFTASRVKCNAEPLLLVTTIEANGRSVTLRDEEGVPVWRKKAGKGAGKGAGK